MTGDAAEGAEGQRVDRANSPAAPLSAEGRAFHDAFVAAIDDDLDMPTALRIARETLRAPIPADERRWLVLDMDFVLGLDLDRATEAAPRATVHSSQAELPARARELLAARSQARAERNWAEADRLRDELRDLDVQPIDRADGTTDWRRLS